MQDPIDAFNRAHPPRVRPPVEPIRFAGVSAATGSEVKVAEPKFRGVYSTKTGHMRRWKGEIRSPR